jgi:outer membrane lipoprotein-sorting protein
MKKLFLITTCLLAVVAINAQSLDEIVKKYSDANKLDQISNKQTIKIFANISMMGMEMPMEMWMKKPNKIKTVTNMNGQEMIQVFDGEKGYTVNPMMGSTDPVEMTPEQVTDIQKNNIFQNYLDTYLKKGQLTLEGEESVNGKPAFKIKATLDGGTSASLLIDKDSYLLLKTTTDVTQEGMAMTIESVPSDYTDYNGVFLPMKTTSTVSGMDMEIVTTFTKVEVDIPIDDSVFKIK